MILVLAVVTVFAFATTAFAYWETNRKDYTISNIADNGGVLWSRSTVKKTSTWNYNVGGVCTRYIKRVASPTISGNLTARFYERDKSTKAGYCLFLYDGTDDLNNLYKKYAREYADDYNRSFYTKFHNAMNYDLKSAGHYGVGFNS